MTVNCVVCGVENDAEMLGVPQKNMTGQVIAIVFVCPDCQHKVLGKGFETKMGDIEPATEALQ